MFFISESFFAGLLLLFACLSLAAQALSCALVAARRFWRQKASLRDQAAGISFLCPAGSNQSLRAAFAARHRQKEIMICQARPESGEAAAADAAFIRKIRAENAGTPSLLIAAEKGRPAAMPCFVKAWQAARYDWVMMLAAGAIAPPDIAGRVFARRFGRLRALLRRPDRPAGLVGAADWGVRPQNFPALLEAVFLNSWQTRRLLAADNFGCGIAAGGSQFWHYDTMNACGGIKAFAAAAAENGSAAAATECIRRQNRAIRLTALPLPKDLSAAFAAENSGLRQRCRVFGVLLRRQAAWLCFYRRFLPRFFYAEPFFGAFLPFLAVFFACFSGAVSAWLLPGFIAVWYAAEAVFLWLFGRAAAGKGGGGGWLHYALLPLRDMLLPFLWVCSLFIWGKSAGRESR